MPRYIVTAHGAGGKVEFLDHVTLEQALAKASELRAAHFSHVTLVNTKTGVEITDVEMLTADPVAVQTQGNAS